VSARSAGLWSRIVAAFCIAGVAMTVVAAQQAPDRSKPPALGPLPALKLPPVEKRKIPGGPEVWIVGLHKVPTVHLQWVNPFGGGGNGEPMLASLTAAMLDEGAGQRSALEIADALDYLGAELTTNSSWDAASVDLHVPVARLPEALPVMVDAIMRPTFPDAELDRLRKERLASLIEVEDDPEQLIRFAFSRLLYGKHLYGTSMLGTAAALHAVTTADLRAYHARIYRPLNLSVLVVAGDVTADDVMPLISKAFGSLPGGDPNRVVTPPPAQLDARHVYLIDKPGAAQSQIRMGWIGVPRSTPDFFAIRVLNTILGGAFTSRLNNNLREVHGYAYGASSSFDMRRDNAGPFFAGAGVQTDKTAEALKEFFVELTGIHQPVPPEELEKAKNYVALQLPRNFETTRDVAASLAQLRVYDLPADYYSTYADRVRAVTAADVKRVADKYIQPGKFAVVIVGDRKVIEPGIKALNLGPITVVDAAAVLK
jgi:zinc protease